MWDAEDKEKRCCPWKEPRQQRLFAGNDRRGSLTLPHEKPVAKSRPFPADYPAVRELISQAAPYTPASLPRLAGWICVELLT